MQDTEQIMKIEQGVYEAIRKVKPSLENIPMNEETALDQLGLASIEVLTVVFEIEDAFDVSLVARNLDTFRTIGAARDAVLRQLTNKTELKTAGESS